MIQDLRYGVRMLTKSPGFTLIAIFTLALIVDPMIALRHESDPGYAGILPAGFEEVRFPKQPGGCLRTQERGRQDACAPRRPRRN